MSQNLYFLYTILGPCITCIKISCLKLLSILGMRQNDHLEDDISNAFSWMKIFIYLLKLYQNLFPRSS